MEFPLLYGFYGEHISILVANVDLGPTVDEVVRDHIKQENNE